MWIQTGGTANTRTLAWRAAMHTGVHMTWTLVEPVGGSPVTALPALPFAHAAEDPTIDAGAELFGTALAHVAYERHGLHVRAAERRLPRALVDGRDDRDAPAVLRVTSGPFGHSL
jgi:hypothetical protein